MMLFQPENIKNSDKNNPSLASLVSLPHTPSSPSLPSSLTAHEKIRSSPVQSLWKSTIESMRQQQVLCESDLHQIESDIVNGVSLPLTCEPPPLELSNTPAVLQHESLVASRIDDYIKFGAVELVSSSPSFSAPHGIQPLHVVLKSGKKPRLVIDLSYLEILTNFYQNVIFHTAQSMMRSNWLQKIVGLGNLTCPIVSSLFLFIRIP